MGDSAGFREAAGGWESGGFLEARVQEGAAGLCLVCGDGALVGSSLSRGLAASRRPWGSGEARRSARLAAEGQPPGVGGGERRPCPSGPEASQPAGGSVQGLSYREKARPSTQVCGLAVSQGVTRAPPPPVGGPGCLEGRPLCPPWRRKSSPVLGRRGSSPCTLRAVVPWTGRARPSPSLPDLRPLAGRCRGCLGLCARLLSEAGGPCLR